MTSQSIIPVDTERRIDSNFRKRLWMGTVTDDSPLTVTPELGGPAISCNAGGHSVSVSDRVLVYSHDRGTQVVIANLG